MPTTRPRHHPSVCGIIILADKPQARHAIPEIVPAFKTFSARRVKERAGNHSVLWQRGYYTSMSFATETALDRIRAYIANNSVRRADDPNNISPTGPAETGRV
jgi:hypothetical protein